MNDPAPTQPLILDRIDASAEHYGVKVAAIDEDSDQWVAFTHDRSRAIAALHRHIRDDLKSGPVRSITVTGRPRWWQVFDACGCGDACPHEPDEEGDREHDDCERYGLPPCLEEFTWMGCLCDETAGGALPVLVLEASY